MVYHELSTEIPNSDPQQSEPKYYSLPTVAALTVLFGPLAGGFLINRNLKDMGLEQKGRIFLISTVTISLLVVVGMVLLPEKIIESIPNMVIPIGFSIGIIVAAKSLMGDELQKHKALGQKFYPWWKGLFPSIFGIILMVGMFIVADLLLVSEADVFVGEEAYANQMDTFLSNEAEAVSLFDLFDTEDPLVVGAKFKEEGLALWLENANILNSIDQLEGLPEDLAQQNQVLKEYVQLRTQEFNLISRALTEGTDAYDARIYIIQDEIDALLN